MQFVRGGFCGWRHDEQLVADTRHVIREDLPWFKQPLWLREFFPSPCGWGYVSFCREDCPCADGERFTSLRLPAIWRCVASIQHTQCVQLVYVYDGLMDLTMRCMARVQATTTIPRVENLQIQNQSTPSVFSSGISTYPQVHKCRVCARVYVRRE